MEKVCFKCKELKPISEYYPHKQMGDGHLNKCKACAKIDSAKRIEIARNDPQWLMQERARCREKTKRQRSQIQIENKYEYIKKYRQKNPEKRLAHSRLRFAIKAGFLEKQSCQVCGNIEAQGHHEDYSKPLEVVWLCSTHHALRHRQLRGEPGIDLSPVFA